MVPAHFHFVDGDLFDYNVGKIFGLSNSDSDLVTSCFARILIGITRSLPFVFRAELFKSSDTFTGCSGVVVKLNVLNVSKLVSPTRASTSSTEVSE